MNIRELSSPVSSSGVEVDPRNHGLHVHYDNDNLPEAYNEGEKHKVDSSPGQAQAETTLRRRGIILRLIAILALGWVLAIVAIAIAGTLAAKRLHELHHVYAWVSQYVGKKEDIINIYVTGYQLLVMLNKTLLARQARSWYP